MAEESNNGTTTSSSLVSSDCEKALKNKTPSDAQHCTVVNNDEWRQRWQDNLTPWQKSDVHYFLEKYYDDLTNKRGGLRVFFPLCGKSFDMKWMADKGHTVIGLELSEIAIQDFFQENNIDYTTEEISHDVKLFKSKNGAIRILACDFFQASAKLLGGLMDAVWDRGSLSAINKEDRQRYADVIKSLLSPDARMLLDTHIYDETKYGGPPHCLHQGDVADLFGSDYDVIELEERDGYDPEVHLEWGLSALRKRALLIKRKDIVQ